MEGTPPDTQTEQSVSDEAQLPHPDSEPTTAPAEVEQPDVKEHVDVPCAGCGQVYGFDIDKSTATFTFQCRKCGTRSEWVRA
jgi:hypothetical protein